ncbi:hypothetical protein [Synechococcus sp. MU1642]|uniref:hypothetical protein n=1 Tax=Synechococcus sp. MU1642 TaxID=2508348 RepID=UPI001CF8BB32|nr:hypothetical protein [Synechococcus sp. MU1642]MCB4406540.1 hypothetical protein [Synechococcus sp. MU1642]
MLASIRAVFADAQTEALDQLYDVINAARDLASDSDFQACYDLVMASGGPEVETWINFTVTTATRFNLDDQLEPKQFLSVLKECCDARREHQRAQPSE